MWLDGRTIHLPNMNGIFFDKLRVRMHVIIYYVRVGDIGIKDPPLGELGLYCASIAG